jgi:chloramphenicol 3-O-phosphotransferase
MIILINGSFGAGKSTVASLLHKAFRGSVVFNPEWTGSVLMRLPTQLRLKGCGPDDFQDIDLWRKSSVAGVRFFRALASGPVIVPMTFSNRTYFDEVIAGIRRFDSLRVFCLKTSLPTIKNRLLARGERIQGPGSEWLARRIVECDAAHRDPHFGEFIETDERSARDVALDIVKRLGTSYRTCADRN